MENINKIPENFVKYDENGSKKIIITEDSVYNSYTLFDINFSDGSYLASLVWIGTSLSSTEKVLQPAIITNNTGPTYLSYDGRANYIHGSSLIVMPDSGGTYPLEAGVLYYFNDDDPRIPNTKYLLGENNKSIRMNNISIFNSNFSRGAMLDFRASMEGAFSSDTKSGYIVILSAIDDIN